MSPPGLDDLADDPKRARELTREQAFAIFWRMTGIVQALGAVMVQSEPEGEEEDRLLTLQEAASALRMGATTLKGRRHRPEFRRLFVDNGTKRVLLSSKRVQEFLRKR